MTPTDPEFDAIIDELIRKGLVTKNKEGLSLEIDQDEFTAEVHKIWNELFGKDKLQ